MCLLLLLLNGSDDDDDGLPGELLERSKRDGVSTFKEREDRVSAALSVLWPNEVINFDSTGVCVCVRVRFQCLEGNPLSQKSSPLCPTTTTTSLKESPLLLHPSDAVWREREVNNGMAELYVFLGANQKFV